MAEVQLDLKHDVSCVLCMYDSKVVPAVFLVPAFLHGIVADEMLSFVPLCKPCMDQYPEDKRADLVPVIRLQTE